MRFVPAPNNIAHEQFGNEFGWWAKHIVEELVLRYYGQGGTDYSCLQPWMVERYKETLKQLGPQISELHDKAFKIKVENE